MFDINLDDPDFLRALIESASQRSKEASGLEEKEAMDKIAIGAMEHLPLATMRDELDRNER